MRRTWLVITLLILSLLGLVWVRLHVGSGTMTDPSLAPVFRTVRAHAVAIAALVGAGLAVAGVLVQGLFRNPLADPGILGVGAGANLGGMLAMILAGRTAADGNSWIPGELWLAFGSMAGSLLVLLILLFAMRTLADGASVLLAGVVLMTFLGSIAAVVRAVVSDQWELSRALLTFSMGDIAGRGARHIMVISPLVTAGTLGAVLLGARLDLLSTGEEEATTLGVDVARLRRWTVIFASLLVAAVVAVGGGLPFVGLLVPHIVRALVGHEHRKLVPLAALTGAILVLACDSLSVVCNTRSRIPLGGITGLLGAPLFFFLLLRHSRRQRHPGLLA